jgi:DNA-binding transcriptional regulator/RsmH inhibitor MraZ
MSQLLLPFTGEESRYVDTKGRLTIPPRWRPALAPTAVLTRSLDGHLILTRQETWSRWTARATEPSWLGFYLSGAWEVPLIPFRGGKGMLSYKVTLPGAARRWAGIGAGDEVALAGCGDAVLVAHAARWREMLENWKSELQRQRRAVAG